MLHYGKSAPAALVLLTSAVCSCLLLACGPATADDSASLKKVFAQPPREYSSAPLWVWNDLLTEDQIRLTLRDLAAQHVKQAFVHPRPGMMTPYLSDDWFRLWRVALDEAERLDMNLWIYDENSYPSGFAGGWVPRLMPESRGRGLKFESVQQPANLGDDVLGVYAITGDTATNVTAQARQGQTPAAERYLIARLARAPDSPWTGGGPYVDLLHPGVTEKFIELTLEPYRQRFGDQFGRRIPGWFTDEPHLAPFGAPHWSDHLPQAFRQRWGYDLVDQLASLQLPVGDWKRVRHNYFQLLLEQFIDRWAKPCYEYCEQHHIEFTGHYWEHGWPGAGHGGDNMAMYAWHQRPAIDNLMNQYSEDVNGQFGNARTVKELSSVANQLGRQRTLCEAYGAGGWDLRFEDMKRIGDWLVVLGVNTLDEHLSYITIRGTRKRDHPQSFSYHTPWWNDYHVMADYFTRLSAAMSHGQQINRILVLQPTTSAWMYQPDPTGAPSLQELGNQFQDLSNALERAQVEYDIGCEDILARHGSVAAGPAAALVVGRCSYHTLVLPPRTENLNSSTVKLLEQWVAAGGRVLCCGSTPQRVDGAVSDRFVHLAANPAWQAVDAAQLPQQLLGRNSDGFAIRRADGDQGILFHMRRTLDDGELVLLVNTSSEHPSAGTVHSRLPGVEQWLPQTGSVQPYPAVKADNGVQVAFDLPPCGSLLLFLKNQPAAASPPAEPQVTAVPPAGPLTARRVGPNVLPLDFVDVTAGGETKSGLYCYHATQFLFQKFGWEKNPWDHAVQFRDEIISKPFPADSRFEATYRFRIADRVPEGLAIVIERPDLYAITCNGRPVQALPDAWWLDRAFGRISVAAVAVAGENTVVLKAAPMTVFHELESAFVIGDFALAPQDSGWAITPAAPLQLGPWNQQGLPCYAECVVYEQAFELAELAELAGQYVLRVPAWYGSVAEVLVDGKSAGHLVSRPWEVDVTDRLHAGRNVVQLRVVGTLKNTLGPHHGKPVLGKAWPWDFRQAPDAGPPPGANYHTVGYGLFEPPVLEQRR